MSSRTEVSLKCSPEGFYYQKKVVKHNYLLLPEFWKHPEKINAEKCCYFVNPLTLCLAFCQPLYALSRHGNLLGSSRKLTLLPSQWSLPTSFLPTRRTKKNNKTSKNDVKETGRQKYLFPSVLKNCSIPHPFPLLCFPASPHPFLPFSL